MIASQRATRILVDVGREVHAARLSRGLSQSTVAKAIGISQTHLSRIERAEMRSVMIGTLARAAAAVGLELSVRLFPAGLPLRDKAHIALLERFRRAAGPDWRWAAEVPLPIPGDRRAWDRVVKGAGVSIGIEAETRPTDMQELGRRVALKKRDGGVDRVILVLADTEWCRRLVRLNDLGEAFPIPAKVAIRALAGGRDPGGDAIVLILAARASTTAGDTGRPCAAASIEAMTVAAVILAASPQSALGDVEGQAAVRRIADAAWSGGALPIVVVSFDPEGAVAAALAGASVTLAEPVPKPEGSPARQMSRGVEVASTLIDDVDAALIWPARMVWVGPETVTSLIEAHGVDRGTMLRPAYDGELGWPVLLPRKRASILTSVAPDRMPAEILDDLVAAGVPVRAIELGDPGVIHDAGTPRSELPPYLGPSEPAAPHSHEWGAVLADAGEDSPLEGPGLAPYGQAAEVQDR